MKTYYAASTLVASVVGLLLVSAHGSPSIENAARIPPPSADTVMDVCDDWLPCRAVVPNRGPAAPGERQMARIAPNPPSEGSKDLTAGATDVNIFDDWMPVHIDDSIRSLTESELSSTAGASSVYAYARSKDVKAEINGDRDRVDLFDDWLPIGDGDKGPGSTTTFAGAVGAHIPNVESAGPDVSQSMVRQRLRGSAM